MPASWWLVFVVVLAALLLAVAAMAVGVIFRRPCLRGSCGGPVVRTRDGTPLSCATCPHRQRRAQASHSRLSPPE